MYLKIQIPTLLYFGNMLCFECQITLNDIIYVSNNQ